MESIDLCTLVLVPLFLTTSELTSSIERLSAIACCATTGKRLQIMTDTCLKDYINGNYYVTDGLFGSKSLFSLSRHRHPYLFSFLFFHSFLFYLKKI